MYEPWDGSQFIKYWPGNFCKRAGEGFDEDQAASPEKFCYHHHERNDGCDVVRFLIERRTI
jgi:hypothetical protein